MRHALAEAGIERIAAVNEPGGRRFLLALLGLLVLAGALRVGALAANPSIVPIGDERTYVETAVNIASGAGHVFGPHGTRAGWPPAHPWLLSFFVDPDRSGPGERYREGVRPLLAAQTALGTLLVAMTALLGRALFDARTGLLAGALAALDPTLVAYSHYLWAETLLAVLVTAALVVVVAAARRPRRRGLAALAGLLFGAAILTRELAAPLAVACAVWWIRAAGAGARRQAAARGLVLLGAAALVVLPWTLRNHRLLGRVVPVSTVGWMALREGNTLARPEWWRIDEAALAAFRIRYFAIPGEMERMDLVRREALTLIRAEQPGWLGSFALVHVVANASSRYRVPLEPLLLVYGSHAWLHARALRQRLRGPALAGALVAALFFVLVCVPRVATEVAPLWREGVR